MEARDDPSVAAEIAEFETTLGGWTGRGGPDPLPVTVFSTSPAGLQPRFAAACVADAATSTESPAAVAPMDGAKMPTVTAAPMDVAKMPTVAAAPTDVAKMPTVTAAPMDVAKMPTVAAAPTDVAKMPTVTAAPMDIAKMPMDGAKVEAPAWLRAPMPVATWTLPDGLAPRLYPKAQTQPSAVDQTGHPRLRINRSAPRGWAGGRDPEPRTHQRMRPRDLPPAVTRAVDRCVLSSGELAHSRDAIVQRAVAYVRSPEYLRLKRAARAARSLAARNSAAAAAEATTTAIPTTGASVAVFPANEVQRRQAAATSSQHDAT